MRDWAHKPVVAGLGLFVVCLFAAWLTELLASIPEKAISIWLPAGVLLSAAIASRPARWPYWAVAAVAAELVGNVLWYRHGIGPALMLALGNALAALTGGWLVRRFIDDECILTTIRSTVFFIAIAAALMPLMSATTGSIALGWSYDRAPMAAWPRLFLGDATGAMIAAPLGLLLFRAAAPPLRLSARRTLEASALALVFAIMSAVALGGMLPFAFLMIPPLIWAALSFRMPGAITGAFTVSVISGYFTFFGIGPFSQNLAYAAYQGEALQLFIIVAAMTALLMGAMSEENREAIRRLYDVNRSLEDRVVERSASLAATEASAKRTANLLTAVGDACPDPIYAKDLDYRLIYANRATLDIFSVDSVDDLGPDDQRAFLSRFGQFDTIRSNDEQVIETEQTLVMVEVLTAASGETRTYRTTKAPLYDDQGELTGLAGVSVDISDIEAARARENVLVREVEHRSRNLLAVIQGIVALADGDSVSEFKSTLAKRIRALARTNGTIAASDWEGATINAILEAELEPYQGTGRQRIELVGDEVMLDPGTAQTMTLVVHELTTNAAKYGSLSSEAGALRVEWQRDQRDEGRSCLSFSWIESGGPEVVPPERMGFGTAMITRIGSEHPESRIDIDWAAEGLRLTLVVPLFEKLMTGVIGVQPDRRAANAA